MNKKNNSNLGVSTQLVWGLRLLLVSYTPLVIFFTELKQKVFPNTGLAGETIIAILSPAAIVFSAYVLVRNKLCSKCGKAYYSKNIFKAAFGKSEICQSCKK